MNNKPQIIADMVWAITNADREFRSTVSIPHWGGHLAEAAYKVVEPYLRTEQAEEELEEFRIWQTVIKPAGTTRGKTPPLREDGILGQSGEKDVNDKDVVDMPKMADIGELIQEIEAENNPIHITPPDDNYVREAYMRRGALLTKCKAALQAKPQKSEWQDIIGELQKAYYDGAADAFDSSAGTTIMGIWNKSRTRTKTGLPEVKKVMAESWPRNPKFGGE